LKQRFVVFLSFVCLLLVLLICSQIAFAAYGPQSSDAITASLLLSPSLSPPAVDPTPIASPASDPVPTVMPEPTIEATPTPAELTAEPELPVVPIYLLEDESPTMAPSLTTGLMTTTGYHPVNIQIENAPGSRPQSGLGQADIVYECLMESRSVTRFQAVFNDYIPTYAGPVRSCRVYFVDIAAEYKGILSFFGGPSGAGVNIHTKIAEAMAAGNITLSVNGLHSPYYYLYWRISSRRVPHNVYTNPTRTVGLYTKAPESVSHFQFNADADYSGYEDMHSIEVQYTRGTYYDAKYIYDADANNYKRTVDGKPFIDANTNRQITVKNIIVQRTITENVGDRLGHIRITLIGSGNADVFVGGKHIAATWERPTQSDITRYYDENHNEIELQPGNTWVQVIPSTWTPHLDESTIYYSPYSAALNIEVGTPASVAAQATSYNSIKFAWGAAASASLYEVYRATSIDGEYKLLKTTSGLSYTNSGVTTGTTYYYKVRAYHPVYTFRVYGEFSDVASAVTSLSVPATIRAVPISYNSIRIDWGSVAGATKYQLYRSTSADGDFTLLATTGYRSYTNKNVDTGTQYFYKVRAYRYEESVCSDYSVIASATALLSRSSYIRASRASSTSIKVTWRSVAGATMYELWSAPASDGPYTLLASSIGATTYTDTGLITGAYRYYKVIAYRFVGTKIVNGGFSIIVRAKP
jgi:fibronectin type 3 domain-containing protein